MLRFMTLWGAALALAACSPAFNWRQVQPEGTQLRLLLPCKPDKAQKIVPLGGQPTPLSMLGCDAGGATFAVAVVNVADMTQAASVLAVWQNLTLDNMRAVPGSAQVVPLKIPGASAALPVSALQARGQRADSTPVSGQMAYFAQGTQLFQVVLYAPKISPDVAETFFSSLKFD